MRTLRECIAEAEINKVAIGHFNISDAMTLRAIFEAALELTNDLRQTTNDKERKKIHPNPLPHLVRDML